MINHLFDTIEKSLLLRTKNQRTPLRKLKEKGTMKYVFILFNKFAQEWAYTKVVRIYIM